MQEVEGNGAETIRNQIPVSAESIRKAKYAARPGSFPGSCTSRRPGKTGNTRRRMHDDDASAGWEIKPKRG